MASPTTAAALPRRRDLNVDAFFDDEWRPDSAAPGGFKLNPANGCHDNLFNGIGETKSATLANPLHDAAIVPVLEPALGSTKPGGYKFFITDGLVAIPPKASDPAKVTVLFCVGAEMVRHGLRTFFQAETNRVLITAPGTEPSNFGYGVTRKIVDDFFTAVGLGGAPWVIDVLAAYSTGWRGLNGTVRNTLSPLPSSGPLGTQLDLSQVKKVVWYDCFYFGGDGPKPIPPGGHTKATFERMGKMTGGSAQFIIYEVTGEVDTDTAKSVGGTPRRASSTKVDATLYGGIPAGVTPTLINLKLERNKLEALILARIIHNGILDGFTTDAQVAALGGKAVLDLIAKLPKKRDLSSTPTPGHVDVGSWATAAEAAKAVGVSEKLRVSILVPNLLMAWGVSSRGDMVHDGFVQEFGWEHLVV